MSFFANVELVPGDPILGLTEAYNADTRTTKVNLGVGIYYDEDGRIPVLQAVQQVQGFQPRQEGGYGVDVIRLVRRAHGRGSPQPRTGEENAIRELLQRRKRGLHLPFGIVQVAADADVGRTPRLPRRSHIYDACGGRRRRGRRRRLRWPSPESLRSNACWRSSTFLFCTSVQNSAVSRSTSPTSARSIMKS